MISLPILVLAFNALIINLKKNTYQNSSLAFNFSHRLRFCCKCSCKKGEKTLKRIQSILFYEIISFKKD